MFRENAYLPGQRARDDGGREPPELHHRARARAIPASSTSTTRSESVNEFDTESFRFGFDWVMSDKWDMRVAVQTGETEKMTAIFDALRVDRLALAIDAVEVYSDRRDGNADGLPDLVTRRGARHGHDHL